MNVLDSFDLSGKVAVVTGGNRGLGEAWIQSLVDVGAAVVIAARDDDRSRETAHRIGEGVDTVHLDVRDADDVRRALATIVERHGACMRSTRPLCDSHFQMRSEWHPALVLRSANPELIEQGVPGQVVLHVPDALGDELDRAPVGQRNGRREIGDAAVDRGPALGGVGALGGMRPVDIAHQPAVAEV